MLTKDSPKTHQIFTVAEPSNTYLHFTDAPPIHNADTCTELIESTYQLTFVSAPPPPSVNDPAVQLLDVHVPVGIGTETQKPHFVANLATQSSGESKANLGLSWGPQ